MKYLSKELNDWAIEKIKKEYKEDVCLLIGHEHWRIDPDAGDVAFNFFIPCTERGYDLAETFIIDGIGYDLFPMSWERVEGLADVKECLTTCLANGVILYAKSEEDKQRFLELQKRLANNLNNPKYAYSKALDKINSAMDIYKNIVFSDSLCEVRKASGFLAGFLAEAIATYNGTYFSRGPIDQIEYLKDMDEIPDNFVQLYSSIIKAITIEESKSLCYEIIKVTRDFLATKSESSAHVEYSSNYKELADWYQELIYTFRRIDYYTGKNDVFNSFVWAISMQRECDYLEDTFGMNKMNLVSTFNADDLSILAKRAKQIEEYIVSVIHQNGVKISEYKDLKTFLKA